MRLNLATHHLSNYYIATVICLQMTAVITAVLVRSRSYVWNNSKKSPSVDLHGENSTAMLDLHIHCYITALPPLSVDILQLNTRKVIFTDRKEYYKILSYSCINYVGFSAVQTTGRKEDGKEQGKKLRWIFKKGKFIYKSN